MWLVHKIKISHFDQVVFIMITYKLQQSVIVVLIDTLERIIIHIYCNSLVRIINIFGLGNK